LDGRTVYLEFSSACIFAELIHVKKRSLICNLEFTTPGTLRRPVCMGMFIVLQLNPNINQFVLIKVKSCTVV
jgi:hypothetical protein